MSIHYIRVFYLSQYVLLLSPHARPKAPCCHSRIVLHVSFPFLLFFFFVFISVFRISFYFCMCMHWFDGFLVVGFLFVFLLATFAVLKMKNLFRSARDFKQIHIPKNVLADLFIFHLYVSELKSMSVFVLFLLLVFFLFAFFIPAIASSCQFGHCFLLRTVEWFLVCLYVKEIIIVLSVCTNCSQYHTPYMW